MDTTQENVNEPSLTSLIRDSALPFISFGSALCIFVSISYHFAYFWAIDSKLLSYFTISDYISSGISFSAPIMLWVLLLEGGRFYYQVFPTKKMQQKDKKLEDLKKDGKYDQLISTLSREEKRYKIGLKISTIALAVVYLLTWLFFCLPNFTSLAFLTLAYLTYVLGLKALHATRNKIGNSTRDLFGKIYVLLFITLLMGHMSGAEATFHEPDTKLTYTKGEKIIEQDVYVIRDLTNDIIYTSGNNISVLNKQNVILLSSENNRKEERAAAWSKIGNFFHIKLYFDHQKSEKMNND